MSRCRWELLFFLADEAFHVVRAATDLTMLVKACSSGEAKMDSVVDVLASSFLLAFHILVLGPRTTMASEAVLFFGDMLLHFFHMLLSSWQLSHYLWTARKREAQPFFLLWASFLLHTAMVWHYAGGIQVTIRLQFGGGQEGNDPPPQPPPAPPAPNPDAIVAAIVAAQAATQAAEAAAAGVQAQARTSGRSPRGSIAGSPQGGRSRSTSVVDEVPPDARGGGLSGSAGSTSGPPPPAAASRRGSSAHDPEGARPAVSEDQERLSPPSESEFSPPDCSMTYLSGSGSSVSPASLSSPPPVPFRQSEQRATTPPSEGFEDTEDGQPPAHENLASLPSKSPALSSISAPQPTANDVTGATSATALSAVQHDGQSASTDGNPPGPAPDTSPERAEHRKLSDGYGAAADTRRASDRRISQRTPARATSDIDSDAMCENGETWRRAPLLRGLPDIACPSQGFSPPSPEGHNLDAVRASHSRTLPLTRSTDSLRRPFVPTPQEPAQSSRTPSSSTPPKPNIN